MRMFGMLETWEDFSQRLRGRFSKLTEDDVHYVEGHEEKTIKKIQDRLGETREEVVSLFDRMKITE